MLVSRSILVGLVSALVVLELAHFQSAHWNQEIHLELPALPASPGGALHSPDVAPLLSAPPASAPRMSRDGDTLIVDIARTTVDQYLQSTSVAAQARLVPHVHNGKAIGVKLYAVRPDSLLSVLGMHNGDTLMSINDLSVLGQDHSWLDAMSGDETPDFLDLELQRAGKPLRIVVLIHS